jgi:Na+/proline symporter
MIPPMIYRIYNPGLAGSEAEDAYILMCKTVLPTGMLGLLLGAMLFATGSSVSTTLNISAGVFTNDIFKNLKRNINREKSNEELIRVGRLATIIFGAITIVVALSVPHMGGIVNVVLKVASITGGALYLPAIWALFSKRHTGISLFSVTIISLLVNLFIQVLAPAINSAWDITRAEDTILGVLFPLICLLTIEVYQYLKGRNTSRDYLHYKDWMKEQDAKETSSADLQAARKSNNYSYTVIGIGLLTTGLIINILGINANSGKLLTIILGSFIMLIGVLIWNYARRTKKTLAI